MPGKFISCLLIALPLALTACGGGDKTPVVIEPEVVRTYAVTDDSLYSIVLKGNAADTRVAALSYSSMITDAVEVGPTMYASTFSSLLKIDLTTFAVSKVGDYGVSNIDALTVDQNGQLYAASTGGQLYRVNASTGAASKVMDMGYGSSGDLAFADDGYLYATVKSSTTSTDALARMKLTDTKATLVGATGYNNVFGLDWLYGKLYGRTNSGAIITINTSTGAGTLVRDAKLNFTSLPQR